MDGWEMQAECVAPKAEEHLAIVILNELPEDETRNKWSIFSIEKIA